MITYTSDPSGTGEQLSTASAAVVVLATLAAGQHNIYYDNSGAAGNLVVGGVNIPLIIGACGPLIVSCKNSFTLGIKRIGSTNLSAIDLWVSSITPTET
jgi:hypothetical protein